MGKCRKEIESLLVDYCQRNDEIDYAIVRHDLDYILPFFELFSPDKLCHCVIAEHIKEVSDSIRYDCGKAITLFLTSQKYEIYRVLNGNYRKRRQMGYDAYVEWHERAIKEKIQALDCEGYRYMFAVCKECMETVDPQGRRLHFGVECAIESLAGNKEQYIRMISEYMKADTPYDARAAVILHNLLKMISANEVKALTESYDFSQKNAWLWEFYAEMPAEQVSAVWAEAFLKYLDKVPTTLHSSTDRCLDRMEKYECVDEDILLKASRIILSHYEESPFVFHLYFDNIMSLDQKEAKQEVEKFKNNIPLLEEIYLKCVLYSDSDDYDGALLAEIILRDSSFLLRYTDMIFDDGPHLYIACDTWTTRLSFIWKNDAFASCMDQISDYVFEKSNGNKWIYRTIVGKLLLHIEGETAIAEKQDRWVQDTIEKYCCDRKRMQFLFRAIEIQSDACRRKALESLLKLNCDYELFKDLCLENSTLSAHGSMVPCMQARIGYLSSLLPLLSGVKYLNHRQKVEHDIEAYKAWIKETEMRELLETMG